MKSGAMFNRAIGQLGNRAIGIASRGHYIHRLYQSEIVHARKEKSR